MTNPVVLSEKAFHKGLLHASISNGNPCVNVSDGIALKFIALNEQFVMIQVLHYGKGVPVKSQSWVKTQKVVEKKPEVKQSELELVEDVKTEELI